MQQKVIVTVLMERKNPTVDANIKLVFTCNILCIQSLHFPVCVSSGFFSPSVSTVFTGGLNSTAT